MTLAAVIGMARRTLSRFAEWGVQKSAEAPRGG
jgi:hypothetical protein